MLKLYNTIFFAGPLTLFTFAIPSKKKIKVWMIEDSAMCTYEQGQHLESAEGKVVSEWLGGTYEEKPETWIEA